MSNDETTVIIATLNEAEGIASTIKEIEAVLKNPAVIVSDASSSNGTQQIAANLGAVVLEQRERGKGKQIALALKHVPKGTKWLILFDGDYTIPAAYIIYMIHILEKCQSVGMVSGKKVGYLSPKKIGNVVLLRKYSFWQHLWKILSDPYYSSHHILITLHRLNGVFMEDPLSGYRVFRYGCIADFKPRATGFDIEVEMNAFVRKKGYEVVEIPVICRQRKGKPKFNRTKDWMQIIARILITAIRK